ncbi:MAG: MFS transporter [Candidatus Geothermarchaeales archaeon]
MERLMGSIGGLTVALTSRNIRVLALSSFMFGLYFSMLNVVLQPFTLSLGVSVVVFGILFSFGNKFGGLVSSLIQPVGGWLSDSRGRKIAVVLGMVLNLIFLSLFLLAALTQNWLLLLPGYLFLGLGLLEYPAVQSLAAESVDVEKRVMAFSTVNFFLILPGTVTTFLGGYLADAFGYSIIFVLSIAVEALNLGLVTLFLKETYGGPSKRAPRRSLATFVRRAIVPPPNLRRFYVAMTADAFSWGLGAYILYGLLRVEFEFTNTEIGIVAGVFTISFATAQLPVGKLIERFGSKRSLVVSEALGIPLMLGWLSSTEVAPFALLGILGGVIAASWGPAMQTILVNSVPTADRGGTVGTLAAFRGLVSFPAPIIGALLYERWGFWAPITAGLAGVIASVFLLVLLVREPDGERA